MNTMWGMVRKNWTMQIIMAVLSIIVSFVGNLWLGIGLGFAIYIIFIVMQFGDGADNGEKACTLTATIEKVEAQGRTPEARMLKQKYEPKKAVKAFVISAAPLFLLAVANLIFANPNAVGENMLGVITRLVNLPIAWISRLMTEMVGIDYTGAFRAGDMVFSAITHEGVNYAQLISDVATVETYATAFDVHYLTWMRIAFIPLTILPSLSMMIGYLQGPKYREKKLKEIQMGTRKKRKKLKVFADKKQPRRMKPEV